MPLGHGPVFVNDERPGGREQLCVAASDELRPGAVPEAWRPAAAMLLGPVAGELSPDWLDVGAAGSPVALGWQGLLRRLVPGEPVHRLDPVDHPFLRRATLVGVSADDVGPEQRLRDLVDRIAPGATLVVTRGDRGGTALTSRRPARSALLAYPAIASDAVIDPTGAGDVFLAALFAWSIGAVEGGAVEPGVSPAPGLRFAAAAASLVVEGPGLGAVPTLAAVRRRAADVA